VDEVGTCSKGKKWMKWHKVVDEKQLDERSPLDEKHLDEGAPGERMKWPKLG
jgi:hypothetical protein